MVTLALLWGHCRKCPPDVLQEGPVCPSTVAANTTPPLRITGNHWQMPGLT